MSNEFQAPSAKAAGRYDPAVDEATIQRGLSRARIPAVALLLVGLMHGAAMLQIVLFAYRQDPELVCGEVTFAGFALALILSGARVYDASFAGSIAGAASALLGGLYAGAWFLFLLLYAGAVSPIAFFVAGGSLLAGLLSAVLAPTAREVEHARRRLVEE